jgi:hypothetical protein
MASVAIFFAKMSLELARIKQWLQQPHLTKH